METNGYYSSNGYGDPYPILREALAPEYAELAPEQIDALFERTFGPAVTAEDVEDIFGSIGKLASGVAHTVSHVAQKAAPVAMSALPGVAQGAMAGAALGPLGMLGGAVLGGAGSALAGQKGPAGTIGKVLGTGIGLAGTLGGPAGIVGGLARGGISGLGQRAIGAVGPAVAGAIPGLIGPGGQLQKAIQGVPAAGQLLNAVFSRPEVLHALQAMMLSPIGRPSVPVAGTPVPVGAFTNLLSQLANQAQAEFTTSAGPQPEAVPEYLMESTGDYRCDPADPAQRAEVLWELLQQSAEPAETVDDSGMDESAIDDFYDAMELVGLTEDEEL